jgi:hypothetical protein
MEDLSQIKANNGFIAPATNGQKINFVCDHTDKLLIAALIILTYSGVLLLVKWSADAQIITFATTTVSGLVGALVALMTGRKQ